jgi:hypothetical protein
MLIPLMTLGALLLQGPTQAGPFEWREAIARGATLEVHVIIGSIRAVRASGQEARVTGSRHHGRRGAPEGVEIRVIREGNRVIICAIHPRDGRWNRDGDDDQGRDQCERAQNSAPLVEGGNDTRIDFEVQVPEGINFVGQTVTEGIVVDGMRANAEAYSVAGDVSVTDVRGGVVDAATISGDITLTKIEAGEVYAGTLSGDINFQGMVKSGGEYSFLSYTGELTVNVPRQAGVSFIVVSPRDGLRSSIALEPQSGDRRRRFTGRQGNGGARMSLTTLNGDVVIQPAE